MPDLLLVQRADSGKWDFSLRNGDLQKTSEPWPAILRLLLQGSWLGDDGERAGESLNDVTLITTQTKDRVTRIAQTRLSALIRSNQITSVDVLDVYTDNGRVWVNIRVAIPGIEPKTVQIPLTR
ncbi:MAG: hypothetical protein E6Q97_36295 [Desulfurellales bacterium]|nr:MAG: hypothetical protein E6Q97_36295 [Desulfurellales bacterium]